MSLSTDAAHNSTRCSYTGCGRNYWRANHSTPQNENRINIGRLENERQDTGRRGVSSGSERTQKRARRSPEDRLELALEVLGGTARVASILDEEKGAMVSSCRPRVSQPQPTAAKRSNARARASVDHGGDFPRRHSRTSIR